MLSELMEALAVSGDSMNRFGAAITLLLVIYSLCFIGAAINHARDIWANGLLLHSGRPPVCHVFWTSLTFIDPLVPVLLLLGRVKPALLVAAGIMLTDVAVNTWYAYAYRESVYVGNIELIAQTAFLIFLLCTAPIVWAKVNQNSSDARAPIMSDSERSADHAIHLSRDVGRSDNGQ